MLICFLPLNVCNNYLLSSDACFWSKDADNANEDGDDNEMCVIADDGLSWFACDSAEKKKPWITVIISRCVLEKSPPCTCNSQHHLQLTSLCNWHHCLSCICCRWRRASQCFELPACFLKSFCCLQVIMDSCGSHWPILKSWFFGPKLSVAPLWKSWNAIHHVVWWTTTVGRLARHEWAGWTCKNPWRACGEEFAHRWGGSTNTLVESHDNQGGITKQLEGWSGLTKEVSVSKDPETGQDWLEPPGSQEGCWWCRKCPLQVAFW